MTQDCFLQEARVNVSPVQSENMLFFPIFAFNLSGGLLCLVRAGTEPHTIAGTGVDQNEKREREREAERDLNHHC